VIRIYVCTLKRPLGVQKCRRHLPLYSVPVNLYIVLFFFSDHLRIEVEDVNFNVETSMIYHFSLQKYLRWTNYQISTHGNGMISRAIRRLIPGHRYGYQLGMGSLLGFGSDGVSYFRPVARCSPRSLPPLACSTAPPCRCGDLAPLLTQVSALHLIGGACPSPRQSRLSPL
jgi:hypothetical protein